MPKDARPEFIESTAGEVAAELARRGIRADQLVTVTIEPAEPDDWITKARAYAHPKVMAEGWSDADIDRIIKEERRAVQPHNGGGWFAGRARMRSSRPGLASASWTRYL